MSNDSRAHVSMRIVLLFEERTMGLGISIMRPMMMLTMWHLRLGHCTSWASKQELARLPSCQRVSYVRTGRCTDIFLLKLSPCSSPYQYPLDRYAEPWLKAEGSLLRQPCAR